MTTIDSRVRSVLNAPRGQRFSRPVLSHPTNVWPESHQERRERLLRQMRGNPRVAYMLEHGELPHWMIVARQRREQAEREARQVGVPADPPTGSPSIRRGRHRAPRRRWALPALAVSAALLLGQRIAEAIGQPLAQSVGFPL
ncbi:MAG TPA: hypothetical protein K8V84_14645 [Nocardiopsis listeri]|uniref:hypothetical protein n=1 Tax=Nocardiopsis listeri TaxID=53440 RepID=UPI001D55EBCF|nr:hypothetical protein [Nocardiopsis listeri]HJE59726.1 hypothetical protein [Nocardiopsis listeri]